MRHVSQVAAASLLVIAVNAYGAFSLDPGDLVVADPVQQGSATLHDGRIIRVDPRTGAQSLLSSGGLLTDPESIAVDSVGNIFVADYNASTDGAVIRIDHSTGVQSIVTSGGALHRPAGICIIFDSAGKILVSRLDDHPATSGIIRIDPVTGVQSAVSLGGKFRVPQQIFMESTGTLLVADAQARGAGNGAVIRVDLNTGAQSFVTTSNHLEIPIGVAETSDGSIFVSRHDLDITHAYITRVNTDGSDIDISTDDFLSGPVQIAVDENDQLVIADIDSTDGRGGIIRVDPVTGAQSLISSGNFFANPCGVAVFVPEPSAIISVAFIPIICCRRRKRSIRTTNCGKRETRPQNGFIP